MLCTFFHIDPLMTMSMIMTPSGEQSMRSDQNENENENEMRVASGTSSMRPSRRSPVRAQSSS